jgi:hypothetical protein
MLPSLSGELPRLPLFCQPRVDDSELVAIGSNVVCILWLAAIFLSSKVIIAVFSLC